MDTYVQDVSDEKHKAQNKVVEMLLPGIKKAAVSLMVVSGRAKKWRWLVSD